MRHISEIIGVSATGGVTSVMLNVVQHSMLHDSLHQITLTFFTGMAGGLGAIIIKLLWEKLFGKQGGQEDKQ